jgi:perosamine synthetase
MIPYGHHWIDEDDIYAVETVLRGEWLTTGPNVLNFEKALEITSGAPCIAVSSGTAALDCAFASLGIKPGDEIITPPLTFIATQATAFLHGAKIVFADVLPETGTIDPLHVENLITSRTIAIVAVDYAGQPAEYDELKLLAEKYGLILIDDAAHSIGSIYKGRKIGEISDLTTFSFFPTKNITTGEGGAVASNNTELLEKARLYGRQGMVKEINKFKLKSEGDWHQEVHGFGLNYRLPDILCALGLSQLRKLDRAKTLKQDIFNRYKNAFSELEQLKLLETRSYNSVNWHLFPIRVDKNIRSRVFKSLRDASIGVQVNYIPAYWHPVFKDLGYSQGLCPEAENFYAAEISLPMHPKLSDSEVDYVIEKVLSAIK